MLSTREGMHRIIDEIIHCKIEGNGMSRNDKDWQYIGQNQPFYGVLSHPRFLKENMSSENIAEFWESGDRDIRAVYETISKKFGEFDTDNALDFGCGVGRLSRAISKICKQVVAVDISDGMLEVARQGAPDNISFRKEIPDLQVDWINSSIVFQHIHPEDGYAIFDRLIKMVKPGGVMSIHITFYKDREYLTSLFDSMQSGSWDGENLKNVCRDPAVEGSMLMYDYDLTKIFRSCIESGFRSFHLDEINHGGCHGFMIYGRRSF